MRPLTLQSSVLQIILRVVSFLAKNAMRLGAMKSSFKKSYTKLIYTILWRFPVTKTLHFLPVRNQPDWTSNFPGCSSAILDI